MRFHGGKMHALHVCPLAPPRSHSCVLGQVMYTCFACAFFVHPFQLSYRVTYNLAEFMFMNWYDLALGYANVTIGPMAAALCRWARQSRHLPQNRTVVSHP